MTALRTLVALVALTAAAACTALDAVDEARLAWLARTATERALTPEEAAELEGIRRKAAEGAIEWGPILAGLAGLVATVLGVPAGRRVLAARRAAREG